MVVAHSTIRTISTEAGDRIFEVTWHQAAQEVDPEKLDMIASLLKNSLSSDELQEHQTRWLLKLLNESDNVQIIMLQSFTQRFKEDSVFLKRHASIFRDQKNPCLPESPHFIPSYAHSIITHGFGGPRTPEEREIHDREHALWLVKYEKYQAALPMMKEEYETARERPRSV